MFSTSELRRALEKKGFRSIEGAGHTKFVLVVDGTVQSIWTVVSRSKYDISHNLHSSIARQLRMPNPAYLRRYVECSLSEEDYLSMLRERGVIG